MFGLEDDLLGEIEALKAKLDNSIDKKIAQEYAEFLVICDRKKYPLITLEDYIANFNSNSVNELHPIEKNDFVEIVNSFLSWSNEKFKPTQEEIDLFMKKFVKNE